MTKINRLVLGMIPNQKCNLKCDYCYISQVKAWDEPTPLRYSVSHIANCLSKERLGGVSLINLTGNGETMLQPDIVPLIGALLAEGHFVEVVTNGTISKHINEVLQFQKVWLNRLFFKISFHYKELKRLNILDIFLSNIKAIQQSGASFTLELLAYDDIEQDLDIICKICLENFGAVCHTTIGRNDERKDKALLSSHTHEEFRKIWSVFESPMTKFKLEIINIRRREFCYAGRWSMFVNMNTGESQPCYWQPYNQNIFKNPNQPIKFVPVGHFCTQPYCINAHSHLAWGCIPELDTPSYEQIRNRKTVDGKEWLLPECKEFFSSRLFESNDQFGIVRKFFHSILHPFELLIWLSRDWQNSFRRIMNYSRRKGT